MIASAALLLTSALAPALPQDAEGSVAVRNDAAFARALTTELGYDDLSELVLDGALTKADESDRGVLLLARCDVRKFAAGRANDPGERLTALGAAGEAYADFLATSPNARLGNEARRALGEVAFNYGSTLKVFLDSAAGASADREAMLETAETVFLESIKALNLIIEEWENLDDEEEKLQTQISFYYQPLFFRALVYYHWGLLYPQDSIELRANTEKALTLLEEFALLVGESSQAGLLGYKHMADAYAARGEWEDADIFYEHVIETGVPEDAVDTMSPNEIDGRNGVIQQAYLGYMRMVLGQGDTERAEQFGSSFQTWVDDEFVILVPDGYRVLLQVARMHILKGEFAEAIALAEQVARENERSLLRLEANEVMAEAVSAAPPDAPIDLSIVYGAAEGAYFSENFTDAIDRFLALLTRMTRPSDHEVYGAKAHYYLAQCYFRDSRLLEAAITHQTGYELYPDDEEFAARNADAWMKLAERFRTQAPTDAIFDRFYNDAVLAVQSSGKGGTPDAALWRAAQSDYGVAKQRCSEARGKAVDSAEAKAALSALDKAYDKYDQIEAGSRYYESSIVQRGMCVYRRIEWDDTAADRAFRIFNEYLEVYVQDPEKQPVDAFGRKVRSDSVPQADFYRGQTKYKLASGGDVNAWHGVLEAYEGYPERNPDQLDYGAASIGYRLEAHLALDDLTAAEARYQELLQTPQSANKDSRVASAAHALFRFLDALAQGASNPAARANFVGKGATYLDVANQRTSRPRWQNWLKLARMRAELGEWSTSSTLFEEALRKFADDTTFSENERFLAQVDLVEAFLMQDKPAVAAPYVDALFQARPNALRVIEFKVSVNVGYPVVRDGRVVEVDGVGTSEALAEAAAQVDTLNQLAEAEAAKQDVNKYKYDGFWRARLQKAYLLYKRAQVDSTYAGKHRELVESLARLAPELGGDVASDDVKRIFEWLRNQ